MGHFCSRSELRFRDSHRQHPAGERQSQDLGKPRRRCSGKSGSPNSVPRPIHSMRRLQAYHGPCIWPLIFFPVGSQWTSPRRRSPSCCGPSHAMTRSLATSSATPPRPHTPAPDARATSKRFSPTRTGCLVPSPRPATARLSRILRGIRTGDRWKLPHVSTSCSGRVSPKVLPPKTRAAPDTPAGLLKSSLAITQSIRLNRPLPESCRIQKTAQPRVTDAEASRPRVGQLHPKPDNGAHELHRARRCPPHTTDVTPPIILRYARRRSSAVCSMRHVIPRRDARVRFSLLVS